MYDAGLCKAHWNKYCVYKPDAKTRRHRLTPKGRYAALKVSARVRNLQLNLTIREHQALINRPCVYCGEAIGPSGVGLDRVDSSLGYIYGNVVPCCRTCNVMKMELTVEAFLDHVVKIAFHRRGG